MSRISQDFINNVESLYEEINTQHNDFLNEDSEYYDQEAAELVEDIISTISTSMIYEGYSAEATIGFLANSSEDVIVEKYLSFDENILSESTISEECILEQFEIFDAAINEGLGSLIGKAATGIGKMLAKRAPALKSAGPLTQKAATRLAMKGKPTAFTKAKVGLERMIGPKGRKAVQSVKDIAQKAKPVLKNVAKLGAVGLTAGAGGYLGAKLAGAGSKPSESPKPTQTPPDAPTEPKPPKPPAAPAKPSGGSPTPASPKPKADSGTQKYSDLIKAGKTKEAEALGLQQWAKANPKLAAKLNADGSQKGTGQSEMEKSAEELRRMTNKSKQRQGELMGGPEGPGKVDTKSIESDLKAEQERQKKKLEQQKTAAPVKESYEPYDIILNYLLSEGHADTVDEANYIMLEMDTNAVGTIMQKYYMKESW